MQSFLYRFSPVFTSCFDLYFCRILFISLSYTNDITVFVYCHVLHSFLPVLRFCLSILLLVFLLCFVLVTLKFSPCFNVMFSYYFSTVLLIAVTCSVLFSCHVVFLFSYYASCLFLCGIVRFPDMVCSCPRVVFLSGFNVMLLLKLYP